MEKVHIVLITRGNTGIGYEPLPRKGKTAISAIRDKHEYWNEEIQPIQLDIEDDQSIQDAFTEVKDKYGRIDTLINNAGGSFDGLMRNDSSTSAIRAAWNKSYSVNVTSTQVVTTTFMPLLLASSSPRLLFVTSGLSSLNTAANGKISATIRETSKRGWPKPFTPSQIAYRSSKTALNMMMLDWVRQLEPDGVKVFGISPGFLATGLSGMGSEFMRNIGAGDPSTGGDFIRDVVEGKRDEDAGKIINRDGVQPR